MQSRGELIIDFLDLLPESRRDGEYTFTEDEEEYLRDIPEDHYYWKITRDPVYDRVGRVSIQVRDMSVKNVFSITEATSATYVERTASAADTYEASFLLALAEPGRTMVLHGPSKTGKSALWRHLIGADAIVVPCTPTGTLKDHYHAALFELKSSYTAGQAGESASELEGSLELEATVGAKDIAQGRIKTVRGNTTSETLETIRKFVEQPIAASSLSKEVAASGTVLVFENYHRLQQSVFDELCFDLRTFADDNVTTVFAGIPADPFRFIKTNHELLGRTMFLPFNYWTPEDLKSIARNGQNALNISFSQSSLELLSKEAAGSPLLMQLYCMLGSLASGVVRTKEYETEVEVKRPDLAVGMKRYGYLYLAPCEAIWETLETVANSIKSVPDGFRAAFVAHLKRADPSLAISTNDLACGGITTRGLSALANRLNKQELTRDLIQIDSDSKTILVANPIVVAYARWFL